MSACTSYYRYVCLLFFFFDKNPRNTFYTRMPYRSSVSYAAKTHVLIPAHIHIYKCMMSCNKTNKERRMMRRINIKHRHSLTSRSKAKQKNTNEIEKINIDLTVGDSRVATWIAFRKFPTFSLLRRKTQRIE